MGFDTELFIQQPVDLNLVCSVCHSVLEKPTAVCHDGHTFCEDCIDTWTNNSDVCPDCRSECGNKILNRPLQNLIMSMKVCCPEKALVVENNAEEEEKNNKTGPQTRARKRARTDEEEENNDGNSSKDSSCCGWEGTLCDFIEKHRDKECVYRSVKCPLGCTRTILFSTLETHKTTDCTHRMVSCSLCNVEMEHYKLQDHQQRWCSEAMTVCSFCGEEMLRKHLGTRPLGANYGSFSGHYAHCGQIRVKCDLHQYGCTELIKRADLDAHYDTHGRAHTTLLAERIQQMEQDKEWHAKEMHWEIPVSTLNRARGVQRFIRETPRSRVGPFHAFLRLTVVNGLVRVFVCVDDPAGGEPPMIDKVKIAVVRNGNRLGRILMDGEQNMNQDGGIYGTWSVGGLLRYRFEDARTQHLFQWADPHTSKLTIIANFRLSSSFGVIFRTTTSLNARDEAFWSGHGR